MKLSILIPTIKRHQKYLVNLMAEISKQSLPHKEDVEVIVDDSEIDTIGEKRNRLLEKATGEYIIFCDSDDTVSANYIELLLQVVKSKCDCGSLKGMYSVDGVNDGIFEHSIKYDKWETVAGEIKYLRHPNHLNAIRASIAKQFKFPEKNFSEDFAWSTLIHKSGLLKTEYYIGDIIYYYNYVTDKTK